MHVMCQLDASPTVSRNMPFFGAGGGGIYTPDGISTHLKKISARYLIFLHK
jgi:hypothetical protein